MPASAVAVCWRRLQRKFVSNLASDTDGQGTRYVGKSTHPSQVENHRQLESEWSDDEGIPKLDTQQGREKTAGTDHLPKAGDGNIEQTNEAGPAGLAKFLCVCVYYTRPSFDWGYSFVSGIHGTNLSISFS